MNSCRYIIGLILSISLSYICKSQQIDSTLTKTTLKRDEINSRYAPYFNDTKDSNSVTDFNTENTSKNITIQESWQDVLKNNQGIKAQILNTQNMEKLKLAAKLSYLPQIDLNAFYIHLGSRVQIDLVQDRNEYNKILQDAQNIVGQNGNLGQAGNTIVQLLQTYGTPITILDQDVIVGALNILYPLYTGGMRYYGNKLASIALKDSYQALKLKELATFEELVTIYYSVVLAKETLIALQNNENSALSHYKNAQKLYKLGQIAEVELLSSQVAYDKTKMQRRAAQNALEIANFTLDNILQIKNSNPTSQLTINPNMQLKPLEYYIDRTLKAYPALQIAHNKITMADYTKRLELGRFMPKIGAFASLMTTSNNNSKMEQMMPNWYAGMQAHWTIISPQGRLQKYQGAKIMQLQASVLETEAIQKMELLVKTTYKQIKFYQEEYKSLDSSIKLATENLRLQEKAFAQGIVTNDSVTDARNATTAIIQEQKNIAYKIIIQFAKLQSLSNDIETFFEIQK